MKTTSNRKINIMKSINFLFKSKANFRYIWLPLFFTLSLCFGSLNLSAQFNEAQFASWVDIDYVECTGIASVLFIVSTNPNDPINGQQLRWIDIGVKDQTGDIINYGKLYFDNINSSDNPCSSAPTITPTLRSYNYCSFSSQSTRTVLGNGVQTLIEVDIPDLGSTIGFGTSMEFTLTGWYDLGSIPNGQTTLNSTSGYSFDVTKSWNNGQLTTPVATVQDVTVTAADCQSAVVNWTNSTLPIPGCGYMYYDIYRNIAGSPSSYAGSSPATPWTDPETLIPGETYQYKLKARWHVGSNRIGRSSQFSGISNVNIPQHDGAITVNVKTLGGVGVPGVACTATLLYKDNTPGCTNISPPNSIAIGTTNGSGAVTFNNIFYGLPADSPTGYRITGTLNNNAISSQDIELDDATASVTANLKDSTAYVVTGKLLSANGCGIEGAIISADGHNPSNLAPIRQDTTGADGSYILALFGPDNYGFYSTYETATTTVLDSTNQTINTELTENVDIQYSKMDTVYGFVGGDCMAIYGPATINVYSQVSGCLVHTTTSDSVTGLYSMTLPAHPMVIKVENYMPTQGPLVNEILEQELEIALDSTTYYDFIFQAPIEMEITGFPAQRCSDIPYSILEQGKLYEILLEVTEGSGCLIDSGYIVVTDEISGYDGQAVVTDTVYISNGYGIYNLYPATPNIFSPFTKPITFKAHSYDGVFSPPVTIPAIVVGASPRGNQFATVSPQIPRIILRDPPGGDSYSFIDIGEKFSQSTTMSAQHTEGAGGWYKLKAGVDQEVFGVKVQAYVEIGASISGSKTQLDSEETLFEYEATEKIKTSDNNYITGTDGDVYIGAAMNIIYSNSDVISFDLASCKINKRVDLVIQPDSFSTQFALTESYILNFTIPDLQDIVDDPSQSVAQRHRAEQSISVWNQVINLNARAKEQAFNGPTVENYTFSNAEIEQTYTRTNSETATIEWTSLIEESGSVEGLINIAGSGASGAVEVNFKQEFGKSKSTTTTTTTTTGFFFGDDNVNDAFTVDYAWDPIFGTTVFRAASNAGQTSCPWEIGAKRDKPFFSVPFPVQTSSGNSVSFDILLGNQSETGEERDYVLERISGGGNAVVQIKGTTGPIWLFSDMQPGSVIENVIVTRPNNEHYQFEGIQFKFYPACDPFEQAARNSFSVFFDSPCSDIAMTTPTVSNGFVINDDAGDKQTIKIGGYIYNDIQSGDEIVLEYALPGTNNWTTSNIVLSKSQMNNNSTTATWQVGAIEDGLYDIRMKLTCTAGPNQTSTFSPRVTGVIDRTPPEILGATEPEDDDYEMGDEISALFNETVVASNASVIFTMLPDDITLTASLILDDNKISVLPSNDISTEIGKTFVVTIIGLEDQYSNVADPIKWNFTVGNLDSDGDGFTDIEEQCIGSALHFDRNGYITVPHDASLNVVEAGLDFTIEAWVFPDELANWKTIASKGNGQGTATEYIFNLTRGGATWNNRLGLQLSGEWEVGNTPVPMGQWSHVAVTVDGATKAVTFYLNGIPDGSSTYSTTNFHSGDISPMYIGRQGDNCNCNYFEGRLDDVIIWQNELTQAEIMATMAGKLVGNETDLVAYYDFDDNPSCTDNTGNTTVFDKSTNANNGTMTGFGLTGCTANYATERNMDNDRDGIPDGCDLIEPCFDLNDTGDTDGDLELACADLCPNTKDVALDFNGSTDFLYLAGHSELAILEGDFTVEAWINPVDNIKNPIIWATDLSQNLAYSVMLRNERLMFQLVDTTANTPDQNLFSANVIPNGIWSHIAVSYVASTKKLSFYINGKLDVVRDVTLSNIFSPMPTYHALGFLIDTTATYRYNGRLDDVTIWSRALSKYNVNQTMAAPLSGLENGLECYYDFNEGTACADNTSVSTFVDKGPNSVWVGFAGFARTAACASNWVPGRNKDSDGDMIGDACDVTGFGCPPNYAGANQLIGDQTYNTFFDTDGAIESTQRLRDPAEVIYNSNTGIELLPSFEVKLGSSLEVKLDGCPD